MSQSNEGDGTEGDTGGDDAAPRQRPSWLAPVVIVGGLVVIVLICIGLSVWGP